MIACWASDQPGLVSPALGLLAPLLGRKNGGPRSCPEFCPSDPDFRSLRLVFGAMGSAGLAFGVSSCRVSGTQHVPVERTCVTQGQGESRPTRGVGMMCPPWPPQTEAELGLGHRKGT